VDCNNYFVKDLLLAKGIFSCKVKPVLKDAFSFMLKKDYNLIRNYISLKS